MKVQQDKTSPSQRTNFFSKGKNVELCFSANVTNSIAYFNPASLIGRAELETTASKPIITEIYHKQT